jgi:hypothetical protein
VDCIQHMSLSDFMEIALLKLFVHVTTSILQWMTETKINLHQNIYSQNAGSVKQDGSNATYIPDCSMNNSCEYLYVIFKLYLIRNLFCRRCVDFEGTKTYSYLLRQF